MLPEKVYPTLPLLTHCPYCQGYCIDLYSDSENESPTKPCKFCKGKGLMVLGFQSIKLDLEKSRRRLSDLIKVYKKELPIPLDYVQGERCDSCDGRGYFYSPISDKHQSNTKCEECKGNGKIYKTLKTIFKEISRDITSYRKGISLYSDNLKNRTFELPIYAEYNTYKINKSELVCIKCVAYNADEHFCYGCANESHGLGPSYFYPINDKAKEWYNNGGYRYNMGYDSKNDSTIK